MFGLFRLHRLDVNVMEHRIVTNHRVDAFIAQIGQFGYDFSAVFLQDVSPPRVPHHPRIHNRMAKLFRRWLHGLVILRFTSLRGTGGVEATPEKSLDPQKFVATPT
jgi:hypothetical protein